MANRPTYHLLSVVELKDLEVEAIRTNLPTAAIQPPASLSADEWRALWEHGGFPEPFLRRDLRFTRRWRSLRQDQLTREDIRQIAQIETLGLLETMTQILAERSGQATRAVRSVANAFSVGGSFVRTALRHENTN